MLARPRILFLHFLASFIVPHFKLKKQKNHSTSLQLLSRRCNRSVVIKKRIIAHSHSFDTMRICKNCIVQNNIHIVQTKGIPWEKDFWHVHFLSLPIFLAQPLRFRKYYLYNILYYHYCMYHSPFFFCRKNKI